MRFVWDDSKNKINRAKHGVSFETAVGVFDDPYHLSVQDRIENGEERWQTLGSVDGRVILLVAHTCCERSREEVVRIISAQEGNAEGETAL